MVLEKFNAIHALNWKQKCHFDFNWWILRYIHLQWKISADLVFKLMYRFNLRQIGQRTQLSSREFNTTVSEVVERKSAVMFFTSGPERVYFDPTFYLLKYVFSLILFSLKMYFHGLCSTTKSFNIRAK